MSTPMPPPAPNPKPEADSNKCPKKIVQFDNMSAAYTTPTWSGTPCHRFFLEVLKDGAIIDQLNVNEKGAYMFGRVDLCDFMLEHPTISRFHAVLQFNTDGAAYIYDLGSTHGTFVNKNQVKKRVYVELHVGDVVRFGLSTRLYILQGPTDLMPPEADLERIRNAKIQRENQDMQESLLRAKRNASLSEGISWGMGEDAIEDNEDEIEEITWQTHKGQLTEKQEKTREKVIKRLEKISHMKKEIDAIRAKDISQGGLTQGQQTQIARNEQRISQILEELENLEETLNESIRESLGARTRRPAHGKKKIPGEEDEDYSSDDDEFYDRVKKPNKPKRGENQSIETADSLLDKRDIIIKEMEEKEKSLLEEKDDLADENEAPEAVDELDAYMSSLSSQLVINKKDQIRKDLCALQSELDRILYLLKIADPTGEASKKRESKAVSQSNNSHSHASSLEKKSSVLVANVSKNPASAPEKKIMSEPKSVQEAEIPMSAPVQEQLPVSITPNLSKEQEISDDADNATDKTPVYTVSKPQWLGAVQDKQKEDIVPENPVELEENDQFVDYKDRGKILEKVNNEQVLEDQGLEKAAPGLIIRKRKLVDKSHDNKESDQSVTARDDLKAEDAVALLLRHSRGYHVSDEMTVESEDSPSVSHPMKDKKKPKKVIGPEKPSFLGTDVETWVPPEGQSGDGRTSLNDRYGY
ncbi:hypothetical protein Leryth_013719 [Lithospermum erythrorhizon]|nr:hypothetical protein Leryth_013719 [Lithospermum erythrorhizon]